MFLQFKHALAKNIKQLIAKSQHLYVVDINPYTLCEEYMNGFPTGTNNVHKERREYECNCCFQFIRRFGNVVGIVEGKRVSIWDLQIENPTYQAVCDHLSQVISGCNIKTGFFTDVRKIGTDKNLAPIEGSTEIKTWNHFYYELPKSMVYKGRDSLESLEGAFASTHQVISRSLKEIKTHALEEVLSLIEDRNLYGGDEKKASIERFYNLKKEWEDCDHKGLFEWEATAKYGRKVAIRNNVEGTLLVELSEGVSLEDAVKNFEKKMNRGNYRRKKPITSKKRVERALKTVQELGLEDSLYRRHAKLSDVSIGDVIWASAQSQKFMAPNPLEALLATSKETPKQFQHADEMRIEDFISQGLHGASKLEVLMTNNHINNLVSIIAPKVDKSKSLFPWANGMSLVYNNGFSDAIKESVKSRGGTIDADLVFSLSWAEGDRSDNSDLDLHCRLPNGDMIYYRKKTHHQSKGQLDVDIQNPNRHENRDIVENIFFPNKAKMPKGLYRISVHNYALRGRQKGFSLRADIEGTVKTYNYDKGLAVNEVVQVLDFYYDGKTFEIRKELPHTEVGQEVWGVNTMTFLPVQTVMYSPNHWGNNSVGNKHYIFTIEGCLNPDKTRGFFLEFLDKSLGLDEGVFQALSDMMGVEYSDDQISGLGFSSSMSNNVTVRIDNKPINIKFNEKQKSSVDSRA